MKKLYKYKFIPQNSVAESTLLGIIFIYPHILSSITRIIKKDYFFLEINQILYTYFNKLNISNSHNILQIIYQLKHKGLLIKIGGINRIISLMKQGKTFISSFKTSEYIKTLITILHENYVKRVIIQYGHNIINMGYIQKLGSKNIYLRAISQIHCIEKEIYPKNNQQIINIKDLISKKFTELRYRYIYINTDKINKKIHCGFTNIDNIISHLQEGNLIIIAGRPSVGKTSFAINIAYNVFFNQEQSILIFSLEMSNYELFNKIISIGLNTEINNDTINKLKEKQWKYISTICNRLLDQNIYINDASNININNINNIAKNIKKQHNYINLIIIDYLQLIEFYIEKRKQYSRSQELGYITRRLKLLAQLLKLPIITISQLNRNIETRSNKEPLLSDLKESGCIKYSNNIDIECKYSSNVSIKNTEINSKIIKLKLLNNQKIQPQILNHNTIQQIYGYLNLSHEYAFNYITKIQLLTITHHHKYLSQNKWIEPNKILLSTTINSINNKKTLCLQKKYIYNIIPNHYCKSYDVNQNQYFTIAIRNIITHNSIEQDADIILTLYGQENSQTNNTKIIDIKIAKNRNGKTGYCKMKFLPNISIFQDFY